MTDSLPGALYSAAQNRQIDAHVINELGTPGIVLMKRAGRALFQAAMARWPEARNWIVLCGGGNNGGDGYVVAALAAQKQHRVTVMWASPPDQLDGDARRAYDYALQEGVDIRPFNGQEATALITRDALVVDALLGTGLQGPVREAFVPAIEWINESGLPVVAADIPSGLCADAGATLGCAVHAQLTVTFIGLKTGLFTARAPACTGQVLLETLDVPEEVFYAFAPVAQRLGMTNLDVALPPRAADAHKGRFGHVLVVGGDRGFGGAALLASEMAAFAGAGLVSLATQPDHVTAALVRRPEVMTLGVPSGQELEPFMQKPDVVVVGPGLGRSPWSEQMLQQVIQSGKPVVLDADALNILAEGRQRLAQDGSARILTPHPGEAARLLGCDVADIESDRLEAARRLQQTYGGVVLLKGAGTVISDGDQTFVADVGSPALATGGSGDVLSGLLGALLAQGLRPLQAAQLAVCVHGSAAELAAEETGVAGLQAGELIPYIRELLRP